MKVTKEHFDKAVKVSWNTKTCLLAQCAIEHGDLGADGEIRTVDKHYIAPYGKPGIARELMEEFDRHFKQPGDEDKFELQMLRASLPIEL